MPTSDSAGQVDALTKAWLAGLGSPHTRDAYRRDLAAFVAWSAEDGCSALDASPADLDRYRDDCDGRGARPATIARRLSALSSFYEHAVAARAITANPARSVPRPTPAAPTPSSALSEPEALALFEAAAGLGPKVAVLVALLLLDGMKLHEALALDVEQLDGTGWAMKATVSRRRGEKVLALDGRTTRAITCYLGGRASGPLLVGDSPTDDGGARLTRFGADFLLKRAAGRAGLTRTISANTLRHSHIALSRRAGAAIEDIQHRVGHANVRETLRYLD